MAFIQSIQSGQLMFFSRILMLDPDNIYKRVARIRFIQAVYGNIEGKQGPVNQVVVIARKKGILNSFMDVIMNGCFLYKSQWKNIVQEKSHEYDKTHWELTYELYEGMDIYIESMPKVYTDIWSWWIYSSKNIHDIRRCSLLLRVVTGDVPGFDNNENVCLLCQARCVGPLGKLIHILECRETQQLRIEKWLDVEKLCSFI